MSHFSSWPGQPGRKARLVTGQAAGPAAGSFTTARLQLVNPFCKTTEMPIWMIYKESHFEKCLLTLELLLTRPSQLWLMATAHCIQINHFFVAAILITVIWELGNSKRSMPYSECGPIAFFCSLFCRFISYHLNWINIALAEEWRLEKIAFSPSLQDTFLTDFLLTDSIIPSIGRYLFRLPIPCDWYW